MMNIDIYYRGRNNIEKHITHVVDCINNSSNRNQTLNQIAVYGFSYNDNEKTIFVPPSAIITIEITIDNFLTL